MDPVFPIPNCRVEQIKQMGSAGLRVVAQGVKPEAACPICFTISQAVHSRYHRHPADLPSLGQPVQLVLCVRRFYCRNGTCARRTFVEPLPDLLAPRARRTHRLALTQGKTGVACGGEAGARLLTELSMPISGDTVLRLIRALPLPAIGAPEVLGVDDWARRKGQTYGTLVVDLKERRVIDLLPDRTAATLANWLKEQPTVQIITRDRSTEYARGAALGAPQAVQVADRWHLLYNLRQMLARWLTSIHGRLRHLPALPGDAPPTRRTRPYPRSRTEIAARVEHRARSMALYEEIRRRLDSGETLRALSRSMGLARSTVRRYAQAQSFPERPVQDPPPSILDPYLGYLEARLAAGCENGMGLWRELRELGFPGTSRQVHRWLSERRTVPAKSTPHRWQSLPSDITLNRSSDGSARLLPPRQLAWLLVQSPEALDGSQRAMLARIEQDTEVCRLLPLAHRFADLISTCGIHRSEAPVNPEAVLDSWLVDTHASGIRAVQTFAAGLQQDEAAIKAALTLPWSNGQAEGQVNKLKLIKRQMYERASFDLLRRRVLLAA